MSVPGLVPAASEKRSASAPYCSMTFKGSMPFPSDLLILRPWSSRTMPWMFTYLNGISPIASSPNTIMRATQKKMMS